MVDTDHAQRPWHLRVVQDEVLPSGWDDLVMADTDALPARELYCSSGWLRVAGFTATQPLQPVVAEQDGDVAGALLTRRVEVGEPHPRIALDEAVPSDHLPARLVGGLYEGRSGPLVASGVLDRRRTLTADLLAEAEELARSAGEASVVWRSVDAEAAWLRELLQERGYVEEPAAAHLVLPVPHGGFEGYVASFPGRYRNMVRRELRKLRDAEVEISISPMTRELADRAAPLVVGVSHKHGVDDDVDRARTRLLMVRRSVRESVWAVTATRGDDLLGFLEVIVLDGHAWGGQVGFDHEAQGTLPVYFGTLFYGLVDFLAEHGLRTVDYTIGTDGAKVSRGCVARPTVLATKRLRPGA